MSYGIKLSIGIVLKIPPRQQKLKSKVRSTLLIQTEIYEQMMFSYTN